MRSYDAPRVTESPTTARLVGIDVARCLALLGMMAVHVHDRLTPDGDLSVTYLVAGGRASALFAVLAGVSMALMSGRTEPVRGQDRWRLMLGLAIRAVLIALLGLWLAGLGTGIAIILTYYGLLFLLGIPFLGLRARSLAVLAAAWLVLAPVVSHLVRPELPERQWGSPDFARLAEPLPLLSELLLTGYYPVLPWLAYLLAGMAVGRIDLTVLRHQVALAVGGAVVAASAIGLSWWLLGLRSVRDGIYPDEPGLTRGSALERFGETSLGGTTPADGGWQWLLMAIPHTATPLDLAHSLGTALFVIGVCLLLVGLMSAAGQRAVAVFFGAGTMTLSLYTLHVIMRSPDVWPPDVPSTYVWHVLVVMGVGATFVALGRRGPLEVIVGAPTKLLRRREGSPAPARTGL